MSNSGDVIDLTNSFILADHCGIPNVIIDLDSDDSFCVDTDRRDDRGSVNTQCFAKGAKPSLRLAAIENTNKKKKAKQKSPTSIKAKERSSLPGTSKKFGGCPICWDELVQVLGGRGAAGRDGDVTQCTRSVVLNRWSADHWWSLEAIQVVREA
ncbi:hypothetical protein B5X24_HaOG216812 [Helicoverpa armigera]|nr:hypothetical protein B5X24_HaOG216812 [Helicoverpa armigera]